MVIVAHKFKNHQIQPDTEVLVIGTFSPDAPKNLADFFYGRNRNNLWKLIPIAFDKESLKSKSTNDKIAFAQKFKIDFVDLIQTVFVEVGQETNYEDNYLDNKVKEWTDIITILSNLTNIKRVCFTRKTLSGIPRMKKRIIEIEKYCQAQDIAFSFLVTPARFYNSEKQEIWTHFFNPA